MDPVLLQSPVTAQSAGLGIFLEMNFEPVLRESVERFLTGINSEGFDFAGFRSVLSRQLQSSADPPIEIVWLYAAAGYYESISARSSVGRVRVARDLLQLLSSCSAAVGGTKCIALTAPAVYDLYQCAVEDGLVDEKTLAEIERFSEAILSYLSICSGHCKDLEGINTGLHSSFLDLVRVWTLRRSADEGSLEMFFPLVGDEVRKRFVEKERCGIGYLAGVVIAEAFLLRLCLKVKAGGASRKGLQKELVVWAVSSITAFSNRIFFEILLKLLLDPKCLTITLLNSDAENLVRGVLYDAVVLVDYSFLYPRKEMDLYDSMRNLVLTKLIVTNEAVKFSRKKGDNSKAIAYLNSFSTSSLPTELIKWVQKQHGNLSAGKPTEQSPQGILNWLIQLEQMGQKVFVADASRFSSTKLIFDESNVVSVDSVSSDGITMDADLFFFDKGAPEDKEMNPTDVAFFSAAQSMKQWASNGRVRRKEPRDGGRRFKFAKYDVQNKLIEDPRCITGISSDSEVETAPMDDKMEESE